jgi:hypothetical protein
MNESGSTMEFYDVGYPTELGECGAFQGSFDFDRNGDIVAFTVEALAHGQKDRRFIMPVGNGPFSGDTLFAYNLGNQIRAAYDREIKEAMWDMDVSAREQEWQPRVAAE